VLTALTIFALFWSFDPQLNLGWTKRQLGLVSGEGRPRRFPRRRELDQCPARSLGLVPPRRGRVRARWHRPPCHSLVRRPPLRAMTLKLRCPLCPRSGHGSARRGCSLSAKSRHRKADVRFAESRNQIRDRTDANKVAELVAIRSDSSTQAERR